MIDLAEELTDILSEYTEEVNQVVEDSSDVAANHAIQVIQQKAPKRQGKYANSFRKKKLNSLRGKSTIVHSPKHYRKTHLLEHGHAKKNGGRVRGFPHLQPAEEEGTKVFIEEIEKRLK